MNIFPSNRTDKPWGRNCAERFEIKHRKIKQLSSGVKSKLQNQWHRKIQGPGNDIFGGLGVLTSKTKSPYLTAGVLLLSGQEKNTSGSAAGVPLVTWQAKKKRSSHQNYWMIFGTSFWGFSKFSSRCCIFFSGRAAAPPPPPPAPPAPRGLAKFTHISCKSDH